MAERPTFLDDVEPGDIWKNSKGQWCQVVVISEEDYIKEMLAWYEAEDLRKRRRSTPVAGGWL